MFYNFLKWLTAILFTSLFIGVLISFFLPLPYLYPVEIIAFALLFYAVEVERNKKFGIALMTAVVADLPILFGWVDGGVAAVLLTIMHLSIAYAAYLLMEAGVFLVTKSAGLMILISNLIMGLVFLFILWESRFNVALWNNTSKIFLMVGCMLASMNSFQKKFNSLSDSAFKWEIAACTIVIAIIFYVNREHSGQGAHMDKLIESNYPEIQIPHSTTPSDDNVPDPHQFKPRTHPEFIQNPDGTATVIDIAGIEHHFMSIEDAQNGSDIMSGFPTSTRPNAYDQRQHEKAEKWNDLRDQRDDARKKYDDAQRRGDKNDMERYSREVKDAQGKMDVISF